MENARERDEEADNLIKDNKQPNEELSFSSRQKPSTSPQLLVWVGKGGKEQKLVGELVCRWDQAYS